MAELIHACSDCGDIMELDEWDDHECAGAVNPIHLEMDENGGLRIVYFQMELSDGV